jgi:hypothetical protein
MPGFGLLSHRQLDASIFGYAEKRTRAEGRGLARSKRIKGFGQTAVLYPDFGLAGLVVNRPSQAEKRLVDHVDETAQRLYATDAFTAFGELVRRALHKDWAFGAIITEIAERSSSVLVELQGDIREAERALRHEGVEIERVVGRLHEVTDDIFVIRSLDAAVQEIRSLPVNVRAASLPPGTWVVCEFIRLGSRSGELIVSCVAPDALPDSLRTHDVFTELDYAPLHLPHLTAEDDERGARDGVLPVTVSPAAMALEFDTASYLGANSMVRATRSATA